MIFRRDESAVRRWAERSLIEQMANVGSEVERALRWKTKDRSGHSLSALERALELLEMTLECCTQAGHLKEIARAREVLLDFFVDENRFGSSGDSLRSYYMKFAVAARRNS